jgi:hypothetical protein
MNVCKTSEGCLSYLSFFMCLSYINLYLLPFCM